MSNDYREIPSEEYKFFLFSPDDGVTFFRSEQDRNKAAQAVIEDYCVDSEWCADVTSVAVGIVTHKSTEIDRVKLKGKLDEDGFDEGGEWWPNKDFDYKCNYALVPLPSEEVE